jgi:glycosyltransferase involved in cell wall biosynthesis
MAVYNGAAFISEALSSILAQSFTDFEFVIIDDGSTDSTPSILNQLKDPRVVVLHNDRNQGLVYSLNRGVDVARGGWVARMDADDISQTDRLARQMEFLRTHPEVGVLGTAIDQANEQGQPQYRQEVPVAHGMIVWRLLFDSPLIHATLVMRRDLLKQVGAYDGNFTHIEDIELMTRLAFVTRMANLPQSLYVRRWHPKSICSRYPSKQESLRVIVRQRFCERWLGHPLESEVIKWAFGPDDRTRVLRQDQIEQAFRLLLDVNHCMLTAGEEDVCVRQAIQHDLIRALIRCSDRGRPEGLAALRLAVWKVRQRVVKWNVFSPSVRSDNR